MYIQRPDKLEKISYLAILNMYDLLLYLFSLKYSQKHVIQYQCNFMFVKTTYVEGDCIVGPCNIFFI